VLEGGSDAVASAALQTIVQARATASGASVTSIETLPAETHGAYRRIGLRLSLSAPWPVLIELLRAIAEPGDGASAAVPNMVIDNLQFRAPPIQTRVADTPVTASFTVFAFRATPQEGAG
jgi:general secretion pathway protein M